MSEQDTKLDRVNIFLAVRSLNDTAISDYFKVSKNFKAAAMVDANTPTPNLTKLDNFIIAMVEYHSQNAMARDYMLSEALFDPDQTTDEAFWDFIDETKRKTLNQKNKPTSAELIDLSKHRSHE